MKEDRFKLLSPILTIVLFLLAVGAEMVYLGDFEYKYRTDRFNRILKEKEKILGDCINGMKPILARGESHGSQSESNLYAVAEQNYIDILEYLDNKLFYWSGNDYDVPLILNDSLYS
jgi:succinate dehydrogenase flavin-adding protein (antitoxin of CptAB toxin-antitoxin module)